MQYKYEINQHPFRLVIIEPAKPPKGAEGSNWHHYVIQQGDKLIKGYRQGSLSTITHELELNVELLNERRFGRRATLQSISTKKTSTF